MKLVTATQLSRLFSLPKQWNVTPPKFVKLQLNMFNKGQQIVCTDDTFAAWVFRHYRSFPIKGRQYTVRDVVGGVTLYGGRRGSSVLYLEELRNPISEASGQEFGFSPERFAPVESMPDEQVVEAIGTTI